MKIRKKLTRSEMMGIGRKNNVKLPNVRIRTYPIWVKDILVIMNSFLALSFHQYILIEHLYIKL